MFRISVNTKNKLLFSYFWCLLILTTYHLVDGEEVEGNIINFPKCLTSEPDVIPKKYPFYLNQKVIITIDVSRRITHQLTTHMFVIFIKEVLGYERIVIQQYDDEFQLEPLINRLAEPPNANSTFPTSLINLETWISSEMDTTDIENARLVLENGNSQPPGRFGWFIPMELRKPLMKYFGNMYDDVETVHWAFLRDRNIMSAFTIDDPVHLQLIKNYSVNPQTGKYYCNDTICENGIFTPNHCHGRPCALLLSSTYTETKFVVEHINELKLLAKVVWLGKNLKKVYDGLLSDYKRRDTNKSFIILYYAPSEIVLHQRNFLSIAFKSCQLLKSMESAGCKYELNRLVKFSWSKLSNIDNALLTALRNFHLGQDDMEKLIQIYETNPQKSIYEMACKWMNDSKSTWETWKLGSDRTIFIGGIFPISASSYNGAGIVRGATMARDAINANTNILPSYTLKLIAFDGKCRADNVMKSFIDYIVDSYYPNLIGVLGPACSDTVEPLAGVLKHFRILAISYSAEGASFSDRTKYPYFFRTIGENNHYTHVYLNLFKKMGWRNVAALTEDGQRYTEYISQMQSLLEENGIKITNSKFPRERQGTSVMRRYLDDLKTKRARIILLDVYENVARTVMCEAYKLQMTPYDGYVWFLPNWLNDTWFDVDYYNSVLNEGVNCTTEQVLKAANGYFSMAHSYLAPDNTVAVGNITVADWKNEYQKGSFSMSRYSGYAYDAVWVYAMALDNLSRTDPEALYDLHSPNTTKKLVKLVEDTDFMGVSGRIKFRGGPSRFSLIDLMQFYDNRTQIVGHFNPNLTDNQPVILGGELKLNMSKIRWFTKNGRRPEDGTLPPPVCTLESLAKFFNVDCEMAIVILNILVAFMLLVVVLGSVYYIKKRYDQKVQSHQKYLRHLGIDLLNPTSLSDLDKWEIPRESVVINRKLGEGAFGTVYGGEADFPESGWVAVAVKTLKIGSTTEEKLDFLSEAEVMKRFDHKNIVRLLGVCTKNEPVYTVMEFMLYGDLKTFLLARRHLVNQKKDEENDEISNKKLTSMALDVARGLSYLAKIKYVHRDLASRNCLVNAERVVKLGDFGMTRPMFENDYYKFNRKGMLPVRWMSPESLALGVFTPASDVWSYGVLLYEIITFGSFPFQGMSNSQVLEHVKAGNTLQIPKGAKPQLVCLMKSCWALDSKKRTPASEIVEFLANNPRLLAPSLDAPVSSVQLEDTDQLDFELPDQTRKTSAPNMRPSPSIPNGIGSSLNNTTTTPANARLDTTQSSMLMENCCPKEPLLGTAKSSSSLINFGKYVQIHNLGNNDKNNRNNDNEDDDDNNEFLPHNPANGFAISKV